MAIIKGMGGLLIDASAIPPTSQSKRPNGLEVERAAANDGQIAVSTPLNAQEEEERTARLAVLYEQEALVSGYLDDANARRQFEDAGALKVSLEDLYVRYTCKLCRRADVVAQTRRNSASPRLLESLAMWQMEP